MNFWVCVSAIVCIVMIISITVFNIFEIFNEKNEDEFGTNSLEGKIHDVV